MSLGARAQGLPLSVDDALRGVLALGVLEAEGVRLDPLPAAFDAELSGVTAQFVARYSGRAAVDIPGVADTRSLFHALGVDPTKTRPSSEALLRRVMKGEGLPRVNPAVDVCNLASLEHQLPLGLYDRDQVQGALTVRLGAEGEGYDGIRKQRVHLDRRLLIADERGPFGAPTSDSAHTAVTSDTRNLLIVVFCPVSRSGGGLTTILERLADLLGRYCSAEVVAVRVMNQG